MWCFGLVCQESSLLTPSVVGHLEEVEHRYRGNIVEYQKDGIGSDGSSGKSKGS